MIELNFNQITTLQDFQRDGNYPDAYRYLRDINQRDQPRILFPIKSKTKSCHVAHVLS